MNAYTVLLSAVVTIISATFSHAALLQYSLELPSSDSGLTIPLGIPVLEPPFASIPVPGLGIELNFGLLPPDQNPAPLQIALVYTRVVPPTTSVSVVLAGPEANSFILTGAVPTILVAGDAPQKFGVGWNAPGAVPGVYNAQVLVETVIGNFVYDVQAIVPVPEPATLSLAAFAILGLASLRCRKLRR